MSETLIQAWLTSGDEQAAEAFYQAYRQQVFRLAYALLGDATEAEEVMCDTMVDALSHAELFDPARASLATWLHGITVGRCRDRERSSRRPTDRREIPPGQERTWQALDQLSPKLREAIVLRYWGEHAYPELAEILRCPVSTAQSRVRVAYEQLRKLLAPTGPAAGGKILP